MARQLHTLTVRTVAALSAPGRHSDGGGLYLNVTPSGARSWVFMWKAAGKRREMGLGSLRDVPLAKARERAADAREKLADGSEPLAQQTTRNPVARRDRPRTNSSGAPADARQKLADGLDPIATRHKPKVMTFAEAADALMESM